MSNLVYLAVSDSASMPVIKEELFARLNGSFGEDADAMVAVDHHDLREAVWVDGVIGKANLVAFACRVDDKVCTTQLTTPSHQGHAHEYTQHTDLHESTQDTQTSAHKTHTQVPTRHTHMSAHQTHMRMQARSWPGGSEGPDPP